MARPSKAVMAARFRTALGLRELGVEIKRAQLRRRWPAATPAEIERRLADWIRDRPPDAPGRVVAWPRHRNKK